MNIICTICSDLITQTENIHVTRCGHVFHYHCLAQWIDRSKTCPQCRNKVTPQCMYRVYPTVAEENSIPNAATLQSQLDNVKLELRQQKAESKEKDDTIASFTAGLKKHVDMIEMYRSKLVCKDSKVKALEDQLAYCNIQCKETEKLRDENEVLKKNMQTLNGLQKVLNASSEDVDGMLRSYTDIETIALFATALKRALCESEAKRSECRDRLHMVKQQLALKTKTEDELKSKVLQLEEELNENKITIEMLQEQVKSAQTNNSAAQLVKVDVHTEDNSQKNNNLDNAMMETDQNSSFNKMVVKIENSDSPYLNLRHAGFLNLTALQRTGPTNKTPENIVSLDEVYVRNCVKTVPKNKGIFHKKETMTINSANIEPLMKNSFCSNVPTGLAYDGMGGHSKTDEFPVSQKNTFKSCVPKITAKHKLKRPMPSGNQDIITMLKKKSK